jgi:hypothetical protein
LALASAAHSTCDLKLTHGTREIRDFDVSLVLRSVPLAVPGTCRRGGARWSASNLKPQAASLPRLRQGCPRASGPPLTGSSCWPMWEAAFKARPGPRQRTQVVRCSAPADAPAAARGLLVARLFLQSLGRPPMQFTRSRALRGCLLAFGLPQRGQLHSVSGSERHARVRQVAGCSTSSTRPAGRWQLGTQRQHNTRCQCSPHPEAL